MYKYDHDKTNNESDKLTPTVLVFSAFLLPF